MGKQFHLPSISSLWIAKLSVGVGMATFADISSDRDKDAAGSRDPISKSVIASTSLLRGLPSPLFNTE